MADFTQTEIDKITATLEDITSRIEQPYGVISIDPDDNLLPMAMQRDAGLFRAVPD